MTEVRTSLERELRDHLDVAAAVRELLPAVEVVAGLIADRLQSGHAMFVFGNGGSAADAQHFAAELVGRARRERSPLPAVALSTDTSALTGISNDYGFQNVFARQVRALVKPGDVVVGITTSGRSENVLSALAAARECRATTVALTGAGGANLGGKVDEVIAVPSERVARVQEMHILLIHLICERVDDRVLRAIR